MCCGSKRSGLSSASASRLPPRTVPAPPRTVPAPPRTETTPAPVMAAPIPPAQRVDVGRSATAFALSDPSAQSPQRQSAAPSQAIRRWRLSS
jgi:hypothetical protein